MLGMKPKMVANIGLFHFAVRTELKKDFQRTQRSELRSLVGFSEPLDPRHCGFSPRKFGSRTKEWQQ